MQMTPIALSAVAAPFLSALAFVCIGLHMWMSRAPSTRLVVGLTSSCLSLAAVASLALCGLFVAQDQASVTVVLGPWFHSAHYAFEARLLIDRLSAPMMLLTSVLCGLVGRFSATYLGARLITHARAPAISEPGQARFFLLLNLFATGMGLLVLAGSLDLFIAGWELVGLSSVLLIAFFHERLFPVRNALRAFITYRSCDVGLLVGTVLMHHYAGTAVFAAFELDPGAVSPPVTVGAATLTALCFLLAAAGKSALFPVGSWLPRAMEGPTPSSAIFYGALSVHAGAYLMLRMAPIFALSPLARAAVVAGGLFTALHGTLVTRVQTDVKSQLAYATTTQLGLIFAEIGLGLVGLAQVHMLGHAVVRTLQLLRAPNAIADAHAMPAEAHAAQAAPRLATSRLGRFVYHLALERFYLDAFFEHALARPVLALASAVADGEARWLAWFTRLRWSAARHHPTHPREKEQTP
jgi:NADH-quinone oxidoreductase subunit L